MSTKDDIKKGVSSALGGLASSIFINRMLDIIDNSADSRESFMAAAERIRGRVALFIDENLADELFALLNAEIGKMELTPGTRRRYVRVDFRDKVSMTCAGKAYELYTTNISEGGMSVETKELLAVGSWVKISLPMKGGNSITLNGVVVNTKECKGLKPAGMGIQFTGVSDLILTMLKSVINRASDQSGAAILKTGHVPAGKSNMRL